MKRLKRIFKIDEQGKPQPERLQATALKVGGIFRIGQDAIWRTESLERVLLEDSGIRGDRHYDRLRKRRPYESRELSGLMVVNDRQLSLVDSADMVAVAEAMDLPVDKITERTGKSIDKFMACQLAANILLTGDDSLNDIAVPGALFVLRNKEGTGPIVRLTEYNRPCKKPIPKLVASLGNMGITLDQDFETLKSQFKDAAADRRGWVGSVYLPGSLVVGSSVEVLYPVTAPK